MNMLESTLSSTIPSYVASLEDKKTSKCWSDFLNCTYIISNEAFPYYMKPLHQLFGSHIMRRYMFYGAVGFDWLESKRKFDLWSPYCVDLNKWLNSVGLTEFSHSPQWTSNESLTLYINADEAEWKTSLTLLKGESVPCHTHFLNSIPRAKTKKMSV